MKRFALIILVLASLLFNAPSAVFGEPTISSYEAAPKFLEETVNPGVMIMLDNSGSMNFNAYGDMAFAGNIVQNDVYEGEPYNTSIVSAPLVDEENDAFELASSTDTPNLVDERLYLGQYAADSTVAGIRFENVALPAGASIKEAYIVFTAHGNSSDVCSLTLSAENSANSTWFSPIDGNIAGRSTFVDSVSWDGVDGWVDGEQYVTPDIASLVRQVATIDGWASGNSMTFTIRGSGARIARTHDYPSGGGIFAPKLVIILNANEPRKYYGYFNSNYFYEYDTTNDVFTHKYRKIKYQGDHTAEGVWLVEDVVPGPNPKSELTDNDIVADKVWDGNWLNWLSMRRIDVLRKVLVGGEASARTTSGVQINYGETPLSNYWGDYVKHFDSSAGAAVCPYDGDYFYDVVFGDIFISPEMDSWDSDKKVKIAVQKKSEYEPEDFHDWDGGTYLAGVLQKVYSQARWGNTYFAPSAAGGFIDNILGTDLVTLVDSLDNRGSDGGTPLSETYSVVLQHFQQKEYDDPYSETNKALVSQDDVTRAEDPYYIDGLPVACAKNYIIILTDGEPSVDCDLADDLLQNFDGDAGDSSSSDNCTYLDDLAYYAFNQDQRSDLPGTQNIMTYAIYAFGASENGRNLLKNTARNGGGEDNDNDGVPDNYFNTEDGYQLEAALTEAFTNIADRTASSTAASVLTSNYSGEGTILQAYFKSEMEIDGEKAKWLGFMHALWIDEYGMMREDNGDKILNVTNDPVVTFIRTGGNTFVRRYSVSTQNPYPDTSSCGANCQQIGLDELNPVFEVGDKLAQASPNQRKIWTYLDKDQDDRVDSGEFISFDAANTSQIKPYLGVKTDSNWKYMGATHDGRSRHLIEYIRGADQEDMPCNETNACNDDMKLRNRTINNVTYKLGDIINSTPVVVGAPMDYYHLIYKDESYQTYYDSKKNRENVVYAGANDGMLHAFTSWQYSASDKRFVKPVNTVEDLGDEIWAYIPQSLLPHLKWLADTRYPHSYYVDMTPKVFDAKIRETATEGVYEWGTFLLCGLNMGGKEISVQDDFGGGDVIRTFKPSYFLIDITDPRSPELKWERTYENLGMSASIPAVAKVGDSWFATFGSGPTDYEGNSDQAAYIYLVDLKTGEPHRKGTTEDWRWGPLDNDGFMNGPLSFDKNLNYNVDAIYMGSAFKTTNLNNETEWKGNLYKVTVPCAENANCPWSESYDPNQPAAYDDNPKNWKLHTLFEADGPITARLTASVDFELLDNVWVYFGTGRFNNEEDKLDKNRQYLYGIKDPFFSRKYKETTPAYYHNFGVSKTVLTSELFNADGFEVTVAESILKDDVLFNDTSHNTWRTFLPWVRSTYDGWRLSLSVPEVSPGVLGPAERCISKPGLIGGSLFIPTFTPHQDPCKFGGTTDLYGLYFETGTGFFKQAFNIATKRDYTNSNNETEEIVESKLPQSQIGPPPPGMGFHAGREKGAMAFMQQGTGAVVDLQIDPALNFKSGITRFREDPSMD